MSDRYSRVGWGCVTTRDARSDFKENTLLPQGFALLDAATENERVASLYAGDHCPGYGFLNEQSIALFLRNTVASAAFPHADPLGTRQSMLQQIGVHKGVIY